MILVLKRVSKPRGSGDICAGRSILGGYFEAGMSRKNYEMSNVSWCY